MPYIAPHTYNHYNNYPHYANYSHHQNWGNHWNHNNWGHHYGNNWHGNGWYGNGWQAMNYANRWYPGWNAYNYRWNNNCWWVYMSNDNNYRTVCISPDYTSHYYLNGYYW